MQDMITQQEWFIDSHIERYVEYEYVGRVEQSTGTGLQRLEQGDIVR